MFRVLQISLCFFLLTFSVSAQQGQLVASIPTGQNPQPGNIWEGWDPTPFGGRMVAHLDNAGNLTVNSCVGCGAGGVLDFLQLNSPTGIPTVIANSPLNGVYASSGGSLVPYCSTGITFGCTVPSKFTSQFFNVMTTQGNASVAENGILSIVFNNTGQVSVWKGSTSYVLNQEAFNAGNVYIVTTPGTSASSGGPTGTGSGITDGSVVWNYENASYGSAKQAGNFNVISGSGGGQSWAATFDQVVLNGWNSNFITATETDTSNGNPTIDPTIGSGVTMLEAYYGGVAGANPITAQVEYAISPNGSGGFGTHYVEYFLGAQIKDYNILMNTSRSAAALANIGSFTQALIADDGTEPIVLDCGGTYSSACVFSAQTSGYFLKLNSGNFAVDFAGNMSVKNIAFVSPGPAGLAVGYVCYTAALVLILQVTPC